MTEAPAFLTAARYYAGHGVRVFPVHTLLASGDCTCGNPSCPSVAKHPRIPQWQESASTDDVELRRWSQKWQQSNIGIPTGRVNGIVVVDVDASAGGYESLQRLTDRFGPLPPTAEVVTGGGGRHFFFRTPDQPIPNSVGKLGKGIDVRADGGFVVGVPSVHRSGRHYEWVIGRGIHKVGLLPLPMWLLELTREDALRRRSFDAAELLSGKIRQGKRNETTARFAGHLLGKSVDPYVATQLLLAWNERYCDPPLDDEEVIGIIDSIAKAEIRRRERRFR